MRLEPYGTDDRALYEALVFNEAVMRQNYGRTFTQEESDLLFSAMIEANAEGGALGFYKVFVREKDGDAYAGYGALNQNETGAVEIEYMFLPQFWGRGYGTELAETLVRMAKESGRSATVEAITDPGNVPSRRILQKIGFALAEQFENDDGEPVELYRKII